jgi:hypothetical protein
MYAIDLNQCNLSGFGIDWSVTTIAMSISDAAVACGPKNRLDAPRLNRNEQSIMSGTGTPRLSRSRINDLSSS